MTPPTDATATGLKEAIAALTEVQGKAIIVAIRSEAGWILTTDYEDHLDIIEGLSETIADPVSGILTDFGTRVRDALTATKAIRGISDDYMTSEEHHPGRVLIPVAKFEQLCAAERTLP